MSRPHVRIFWVLVDVYAKKYGQNLDWIMGGRKAMPGMMRRGYNLDRLLRQFPQVQAVLDACEDKLERLSRERIVAGDPVVMFNKAPTARGLNGGPASEAD